MSRSKNKKKRNPGYRATPGGSLPAVPVGKLPVKCGGCAAFVPPQILPAICPPCFAAMQNQARAFAENQQAAGIADQVIADYAQQADERQRAWKWFAALAEKADLLVKALREANGEIVLTNEENQRLTDLEQHLNNAEKEILQNDRITNGNDGTADSNGRGAPSVHDAESSASGSGEKQVHAGDRAGE